MDNANPIVPPLAPAAPDGPKTGQVRSVCRFTASSQDPLGLAVKCRFHWGDTLMSEWTEPAPCGTPHTLAHVWARPGQYEVRAQAKNARGVQSDWGPALIVSIADCGREKREGERHEAAL